MYSEHALTIAIFLPIIGAVLVLATGGDHNAALAGRISLIVALLAFLATIPLYTGFDPRTAQMQFVVDNVWIEAFNVHYRIGLDGISMPLVLLTSFSTLLVVIAGWVVIERKVAQYMAAFLVMEGLMIGVFSSLDAMLFYVFWEAMLVPMFLIIGLWGGQNRVYATIKFFLYTFIGSVLMLVAFIYLYFRSNGRFYLAPLQRLPPNLYEQ